MIREIWARFKSDCRDLWTLLTKGAPAEDQADIYAILADAAKIIEPKVDMFLWQCEQIRKCPSAFWNDPWLLEPDFEPTEHQRRQNWEASRDAAVARYGRAKVMDRGQAVAEYIKGTPQESIYWVQPDPFGWAMKLPLPNKSIGHSI